MRHSTPQPTVSVISGFHNRANMVDYSVQSVLDQTFTDFEFIVFDDASTDGTGDRLAAFSDSRLHLIRQTENLGFVRSLIAALSIARGKYIAIHGSGDISYPNRLQEQVSFLESNPDYGAVGSYRDVFDETGRKLWTTRPTTGEITHEDLLKRNYYSHGEVMYRKDVYDKVGGYREMMKFAQDYELWLRMSQLSRFGLIPRTLYGRFTPRDGASFSPRKILEQTAFAILARKLLHQTPEDIASISAHVIEQGVLSVVPPNSPDLVERAGKRMRKLLALGRWDDAYSLGFELVPPAWGTAPERSLLRTLIFLGSLVDPNGRIARAATRLAGKSR